MRDAISRFDDRVEAIGDPDPPAPPLELREVCRYLLRRATPALLPVGVAVIGQFYVTDPVSGALTALGVAAAASGGIAGSALALGTRFAASAATVVAAALLIVPPAAVTDGVNDLFTVHLGLFGVVTLFVAAVCYGETAGLPRTTVSGSAGDGEG